MRSHQYTIRNVPHSVDRVLRQRASERDMSLNDVLLEALKREAGVDQVALYHDLDFLAGSWVPDPEVDKLLAEQRTVDPKDWK